MTIRVPGCSLSKMTLKTAIKLLRFKTSPLAVTTAERSTSVSKMTPRSAWFSRTAALILAIASGFSGFGMWLGKCPSGSKNCEPCVSAPSVSRTFLAKNPPAPLPASTMIFIPESGFSEGAWIPFLIFATRSPA